MSLYDQNLVTLQGLRDSEKESDKIRASLRDFGWLRATQGESILCFIGIAILTPKARSYGMTKQEVKQELESGKYLANLARKEGRI